MIFLTVGTELPFDRLVRVVDDWARRNARQDVFAQIGQSLHPPTHIKWSRFLEPPEFQRRFAEANVVISHAGMGTILTALYAGKPLLVMPRRAELGEHRNEHQLATAARMRELEKICVADGNASLLAALDRIDEISAGARIDAFASQELVSTVREFIAKTREERLARQSIIDRLSRGVPLRTAFASVRHSDAR